MFKHANPFSPYYSRKNLNEYVRSTLSICSLLLLFGYQSAWAQNYDYQSASSNQNQLARHPSNQFQFMNTDNGQQNKAAACCPCDEAKYELIFEGLWSKYTHPDEFPESESVAFFGDIIGASHSSEFHMWQLEAMASDGVKELANSGSTKRLESELKLASARTRTIIKARELRYPTLNSKTSAVFRTDRRHHLVSILSKLGPSPDWMVGVTDLDLCQADCTWTTQRIVNLFPLDAGIDSGVNFTKSDRPTIPQDPIRPYNKSNKDNPNNQLGVIQLNGSGVSNSAWLSDGSTSINNNDNINTQVKSNGNSYPDQHAPAMDLSFSLDQSKPFARLTITRQRIYEKSCNHSDQPTNYHLDREQHSRPTWPSNSGYPISPTSINTKDSSMPLVSDCRYTNWSDWTSCTSSCGKGIRTRTRSFKNDRYAQSGSCSISDLVEKEICLAECRANSTCYTRDWGTWSRCSVDCGQGRRKRTRAIIEPRSLACESGVELVEEEPCLGMGDCSGAGTGSQPLRYDRNHPPPSMSYEERVNNNVNCEVSSWSAWTECSRHPCGGTRIRTRQYMNRESVTRCKTQLIQKRQCPANAELCRLNLEEAAIKCNLVPDEGPCHGEFTRWYYDNSTQSCGSFTFRGCAGNENNFDTIQDCHHSCLKPMRKLSMMNSRQRR